MIRTVAEAREAVRAEPKRFRCAFLEGPEAPMLDSPKTEVRLFRHKKTGEEMIRERLHELEADGFKQLWGGLGRGILKLGRGDEVLWLGLDHAGRFGAR